jgi:monoamine oxidase
MTSNVVTVNVNDPSLSITKSVDGSQSVTVTPPSTNHTFTLTPSGSGTFNTALVVSDYMPNYQAKKNRKE